MTRPTPTPPRPTEAELAILRVLWRDGPATVREVMERLRPGRELRYTTVLKFLQIMTEKGLVSRDERARSHVYAPTRTEEATQRELVLDLITRAFGGSAQQLVLRALSSRAVSAEELAEIRRELDDLERRPR
jgi:predicted transcriptional regulator